MAFWFGTLLSPAPGCWQNLISLGVRTETSAFLSTSGLWHDLFLQASTWSGLHFRRSGPWPPCTPMSSFLPVNSESADFGLQLQLCLLQCCILEMKRKSPFLSGLKEITDVTHFPWDRVHNKLEKQGKEGKTAAPEKPPEALHGAEAQTTEAGVQHPWCCQGLAKASLQAAENLHSVLSCCCGKTKPFLGCRRNRKPKGTRWKESHGAFFLQLWKRPCSQLPKTTYV